MVASVQELLLASQAKYQRPKSQIGELADIINGGIQNFGNAQSQYLDISRKMVERQVIEEQMKQDEIDKQRYAKAEEDATRKAVKNLGMVIGVTPVDKLDAALKESEEITLSNDGKFSRTYKTVTADAKTPTMTPYQSEMLRLQREKLDLDRKKDEAKAAEAGKKSDASIAGVITQADRIAARVGRAIGQVGPMTTGLGSALAKIPGTDARDLRSTLATIKANLGFAELQAMRQASPTGGALGQVAVQELESLQSTVDSLDQGQSDEQIIEALTNIKKHVTNWKQAVQGAGGASPMAEPNATPSLADDGIGWSDAEEQELRELEKQFGGR